MKTKQLKKLKINKFRGHHYSKNQIKEENHYIGTFNEILVHITETIYAQKYTQEENKVINDSPLCFDRNNKFNFGQSQCLGSNVKKRLMIVRHFISR